MARPSRAVGADDSSMLGVSSQRIDVGFNPLSARLMHHEHLTRVFHGGSPGGPHRDDCMRKFRPEASPGIGDGKPYGAEREQFLQSSERDFNSGSSGMLSSVERDEGSVDEEGHRIINGSSHVSNTAKTSARVPGWAGSERTGGMVGEAEYRELEERDGVSSGSQSEGSEEEEDEDDGDIDGEGEHVGHQGVGRMVDGGLIGQKDYQSLSHAQVGSIDARHELAGLQTSEGFQKAKFDRERVSKASTSSAPSLGTFLSPSSTIPFLDSFASSPSVGPMLGPVESNPAQNGAMVVSVGLESPPYYRDSVVKETGVSKGMCAKERGSFPHEQSRIAQRVPMQEAIPVGALTTETGHYYSSILHPSAITPQKDPGNQIVAVSHMKSNETMEQPLRSVLMDPCTGALMDDATILLCGHSFGSDGLQRVFETNACISCGAAAKREDMAPNYALRSVVQAFRREQEVWRGNSSTSAKRRRERLDQDRQNSGELTAWEISRVRNVQFPYKVNDRVLIKGNKRTPERFVGRNAVITTQCLNGWYVVRTLDNGESVKLQYRSLMKMGEQPSSNEVQAKIVGPNWL